MKQPLEALERLGGKTEDYKVVKTALKELEDIKSGKIRFSVESGENYVAVPNYQYERDLKKLEALEIIKEKRVNVHLLILSNSLEKYNYKILPYRKLTQEEYDLLKEVLLWD